MLSIVGTLIGKSEVNTIKTSAGRDVAYRTFVILDGQGNNIFFKTTKKECMNILDEIEIYSKVEVAFFVTSKNRDGFWHSNNICMSLIKAHKIKQGA